MDALEEIGKHVMTDLNTLLNLASRAQTERATHPTETWWYLSFATKDAFIGGVIVRGSGIVTARINVADLGLSPEGEAWGFAIERDGVKFDVNFANRLLTAEEVNKAFAVSGGAGKYGSGKVADA